MQIDIMSHYPLEAKINLYGTTLNKGLEAFNNGDYEEAMDNLFICEDYLKDIAQILKKEMFISQSQAINPVDMTVCFPKRIEKFHKSIQQFYAKLESYGEFKAQKISYWVKKSVNNPNKPGFIIKAIDSPSKFIKDIKEKKQGELVNLYEKEEVMDFLVFLYNLSKTLEEIIKI